MSASADQLVALLLPSTAAADEHPGGTGGSIVARSAHDSGVAISGERHGGTLGKQPPSRCVGRANQFTALLRPHTIAANEYPCRSGRTDSRQAVAINIAGTRPANDSGTPVRR